MPEVDQRDEIKIQNAITALRDAIELNGVVDNRIPVRSFGDEPWKVINFEAELFGRSRQQYRVGSNFHIPAVYGEDRPTRQFILVADDESAARFSVGMPESYSRDVLVVCEFGNNGLVPGPQGDWYERGCWPLGLISGFEQPPGELLSHVATELLKGKDNNSLDGTRLPPRPSE
jgi:hypothetical protein